MPTLRQATQLAKVNSLNNLGEAKDAFTTENTLSVIEKACGEFIKRVQNNLKATNSIVTGKIADIQTVQNGSEIDITANAWLDFQDKGVNGSEQKPYDTPYSYKDKRPPIQPFIDWVHDRNINSKNNEKHHGKADFKEANNTDSQESIAYAIRESVYQKGFKPKNVYSKEIPQLIEDCKNALGNYIVEVVKKTF